MTSPSTDQGNTIKYYRTGSLKTLNGDLIFASAHLGLTVVQPMEHKEQPMDLRGYHV